MTRVQALQFALVVLMFVYVVRQLHVLGQNLEALQTRLDRPLTFL